MTRPGQMERNRAVRSDRGALPDTDASTNATTAAYYQVALRFGVVELSEVQTWIDQRLREARHLPYPLMNAALTSEPDELVHALRPLAAGGDAAEVRRRLLTAVSRDAVPFAEHADAILRALVSTMAGGLLHFTAGEEEELLHIVDAFALARSGHNGTEADAIARLAIFVQAAALTESAAES